MLKVFLGFVLGCMCASAVIFFCVIMPKTLVIPRHDFTQVGDLVLPSDICVTSTGVPYTLQFAYNYPIITLSYITMSGNIAIAVYDFTETIVTPHRIGYVPADLDFTCLKLGDRALG